jgi:hypothetical protein
VRQGVHDVVDADANAERGILLFSFFAEKGRAVYKMLMEVTPLTALSRCACADFNSRSILSDSWKQVSIGAAISVVN